VNVPASEKGRKKGKERKRGESTTEKGGGKGDPEPRGKCPFTQAKNGKGE